MKNILITTAIVAGVAMSASAVQAQRDGFNLGFRSGNGTGMTLGYDFGSIYAGVQYGRTDNPEHPATKKSSFGVEALYNLTGPLSMGLGYYDLGGIKHYAVLGRLSKDLGTNASVYVQTEVYTKGKGTATEKQAGGDKDMFTHTSVGIEWNMG